MISYKACNCGKVSGMSNNIETFVEDSIPYTIQESVLRMSCLTTYLRFDDNDAHSTSRWRLCWIELMARLLLLTL